jgi:large repetitive protein
MTGRIRHAAHAMALILLTAGGAGFASAGDLSNTAQATATAPGGAAVNSPTSTVDVPVIPAVRSMSVTKTGAYSDTDGDPGFTDGDTIAWSVTVQNTGNVTVSAITVADPLVSLICPVSGNNTIASIAPGNSVICTANSSITQASIDNNGGGDGDIDNTATATGSAPGPGGPVVAVGSASVPIVLTPSMTIAKSAYEGGLPISLGGSGTPVAADRPAGTVITYVYIITNTGNSSLTNVTVADAHDGLGAPVVPGSETGVVVANGSTDGAANASWDLLRPDDQIAFSATYTLTQDDVDQRQ